MKISINILKYTVGLPFLLVLTLFSFFLNVIFYSAIVLPITSDKNNKLHFKEMKELAKELWEPIKWKLEK